MTSAPLRPGVRLATGFVLFFRFVRSVYDRKLPADETLWHKWFLLFPRWIDGGPQNDVWRRRGPKGWEYKAREETDEEHDARQW